MHSCKWHLLIVTVFSAKAWKCQSSCDLLFSRQKHLDEIVTFFQDLCLHTMFYALSGPLTFQALSIV